MQNVRTKRAQGAAATTILALSVGACIGTLNACAPQPEALPAPQAKASEAPLKKALPVGGLSGQVPADLLSAIIADLAERKKLRTEDIEVVREESAVWPDGALGCPKPGEIYTHAQVPGYWVVLRAEGKEYDYRASAKGPFRACSNPFKRQLPVG